MGLADQKPAFDEVDPFLHLVLGLVPLGERLDDLLDRQAPARGGLAPAPDSPELFALLGAIALRQRLGEVLALLGPPEPGAESPAPELGDLLR